MEVLGIDIGGSGIKGAIVDIEKGELVTDRFRIPTPAPATPQKVADVIKELVLHFSWNGPVGCGFPAALKEGVALTASNIHKSWIGTNVAKLFEETTGLPFTLLNDADAAGLAEAQFGAGKGQKGVVFIVTVGTGLGTALCIDGILIPNTELGHIRLKKGVAEPYASDATRKKEDLSWKQWANRFEDYLQEIEKLFYPNLIIVGGGTSKKFEKFEDHIDINAPIIPAKLLNNAGMIGAAYAASLRVGAH